MIRSISSMDAFLERLKLNLSPMEIWLNFSTQAKHKKRIHDYFSKKQQHKSMQIWLIAHQYFHEPRPILGHLKLTHFIHGIMDPFGNVHWNIVHPLNQGRTNIHGFRNPDLFTTESWIVATSELVPEPPSACKFSAKPLRSGLQN